MKYVDDYFINSAPIDQRRDILNTIYRHSTFLSIAIKILPIMNSGYLPVAELNADYPRGDQESEDFIVSHLSNLDPATYRSTIDQLRKDGVRFRKEACEKRPDLCNKN